MKKLTFALLSVSIMTFSQVSGAKMLDSDAINLKAVPSSHLAVVAPGTRLVAGNASENEFYIIGANSEQRPTPTPRIARVDVAKIKVAISETLHQAHVKKASSKVKKVASRTKKQKLAKSKAPSQVKVSLNQKHHRHALKA